jgi:hypothetical protein
MDGRLVATTARPHLRRHQLRMGVDHAAMLLRMLLILLAGSDASADPKDLIGNWRLKSFVREVAGTGERYDQLGPHPDGVLSYSEDGRVYVLFTAGDRKAPAAGTPATDAEAAQLFRTMLAYAGRYRADEAKVIHTIEIAWDGARLGEDQVRFYSLEGDRLTLRTTLNRSPIDGREGVGVLTFERIRSAR